MTYSQASQISRLSLVRSPQELSADLEVLLAESSGLSEGRKGLDRFSGPRLKVHSEAQLLGVVYLALTEGIRRLSPLPHSLVSEPFELTISLQQL